MDEPKVPISEGFTIIIITLMVCLLLVEGGLLIYSYAHADKVECNWIFCTFTTERTTITTTIMRECFEGATRINCTEILE